MNTSKKIWLVDLDGTLYRPGLVKWAMALELLLFGWAALSIIRTFRKTHEEIRSESEADPKRRFFPSPFDEQIRRTASRSGSSESRVRRVVNTWMFQKPGKWLRLSLRTELIKEIEAHRASGGKTALVTDYPAEKKLQAMGLSYLFDHVIACGETSALERLKPAPDSIQAALKSAGVDADDALMIGDRIDADGAAAKAAGVEFRHIQ